MVARRLVRAARGRRWAIVNFAGNTGEYFREKIELAFFVQNLKDKEKDAKDKEKTRPEVKFPKAWLFETGTNEWRRFDSWPPGAGRAANAPASGRGRQAELQAGTAGGTSVR